jgi:hypothetical protein
MQAVHAEARQLQVLARPMHRRDLQLQRCQEALREACGAKASRTADGGVKGRRAVQVRHVRFRARHHTPRQRLLRRTKHTAAACLVRSRTSERPQSGMARPQRPSGSHNVRTISAMTTAASATIDLTDRQSQRVIGDFFKDEPIDTPHFLAMAGTTIQDIPGATQNGWAILVQTVAKRVLADSPGQRQQSLSDSS